LADTLSLRYHLSRRTVLEHRLAPRVQSEASVSRQILLRHRASISADSCAIILTPTTSSKQRVIMTDFDAQIREASAKNTQLLRVLGDTDHAKPALEEQLRFIHDLDSELANLNRRIQALDNTRKLELKDHEKYRDSNVRRFMYKATGQKEKFSQKAEKEEREYFEVLQKEHQAKQIRENLQEQLDAAHKVRSELEPVVRQHDNAQQELDRLYHSIFSGPTPQFPQEDEKERHTDQMLQAYHDTRLRLEAEAHTAQFLGSAMPMIQRALMHIEQALSHSRMDMFGGGAMSDYMERQQLSMAEANIQRAQQQVQRARQASPHIPQMPPIRINHGDILTDVFFDNLYTDMMLLV
jgi:DNA repair exonuclease SbcCD ATPase subunit